MMFVAVIMGIVGMAFFHFMGSIGTAYKAQMDLEARVDLFQTLNSMQRIVDCKATIDSIPSGTVIPASGMPIALIGSAAGGATYISEYGGRKGKFSYIADVFPDNSIKIQAAAFKADVGLPRNRLSAPDSEFLSKKSTPNIWNWTYTNALIDKDFASISSICGGAAAAGGGDITMSCTSRQISGGTSISFMCMLLNTSNGKLCSVNAGSVVFNLTQANVAPCLAFLKAP